ARREQPNRTAARSLYKWGFGHPFNSAGLLVRCSVLIPPIGGLLRAFASGLFSEPAAGRLPLALRRLVCRHTLNPIFVRLRFLIFLIAFLTLRHGTLLF